MPLPLPILIGAGLALFVGFTAARTLGRRSGKKPLGMDQETPPRSPGLNFKEFLDRHLSAFSAESFPITSKPQAAPKRKRHRWIRILNRVFFPLCAGAFGMSFFFNSYDVLRVLAVSGMIGFGTNWLAITMLFHPRKKHILLGHGLIPRQREEIIEALAEGVFRNLINEEIIKRQLEASGLIPKITTNFRKQLHELIERPAFREDLKLLIETYIREFSSSPEHRDSLARLVEELLNRLELGGVMGRLVTWSKPVWKDSALDEIDKWIEHELPTILNENLDLLDEQLAKLPIYIEKESDSIERWLTSTFIYFIKQMDIKKTILDRLGTFDAGQVETLIKNASTDQLGYITLLGGILGVIGGFVIWNPIAVAWIAGSATAVAVTDFLLTRLLAPGNRRALDIARPKV